MSFTEQRMDLSLAKSFNCQGIYAIKSLTSKKLYIGSSTNVKNRILQHINLLNKKEINHHSVPLQRAWDKYNQSDFVAIFLEEVLELNDLISREQYWIDKFNSYKKGYNGRPKAEANYGMEWSNEQNELRRISNIKKWKDPLLRNNLSQKFRGKHRGIWTDESHKKVSETLKERHQENPNWSIKNIKILNSPENIIKRKIGIRNSLKNANVYENRIKQLKLASESVERIENLRITYFKSHKLEHYGILSLRDFEDKCIELYKQGYSLREIGKKYNLDHKSISSLLKRLGIKIEKRYSKGIKNNSSKLDEDKVKSIRNQIKDGYSLTKIAGLFGVNRGTISDIKLGKTWNHVF